MTSGRKDKRAQYLIECSLCLLLFWGLVFGFLSAIHRYFGEGEAKYSEFLDQRELFIRDDHASSGYSPP